MFEYDYLLKLLTKRNKEIDKLRAYKVVVDYLRDHLMHSNVPIEHVNNIMGILNYAEDEKCLGINFYDEKYINKDLRRILEII